MHPTVKYIQNKLRLCMVYVRFKTGLFLTPIYARFKTGICKFLVTSVASSPTAATAKKETAATSKIKGIL